MDMGDTTAPAMPFTHQFAPDEGSPLVCEYSGRLLVVTNKYVYEIVGDDIKPLRLITASDG